MNNLANVIDIKKDNIVSDYIELFLKKKRNNSELTYQSYKTDISQFFYDNFNIDTFFFITEDMIKSLNSIKVQKYYQDMLDNNKYASATITRKISAMRELFEGFIQDGILDSDNNRLMVTNPLATLKIKANSKEYGAFKLNEVMDIIKLVMDDDEKELATYYALLLQSGLRGGIAMDLTMDNFIKIKGVWYIQTRDKHHNEQTIAVENFIYNNCKEIANKETGKIFNFAKNKPLTKLCGRTTYNKNGTIKTNYKNTYAYKIGISEDEAEKRNLTVHSIRKALASECALQKADVGTLASILNHRNTQTLLKYINKANNTDAVNANLNYIHFEDYKSIDEQLENKLNSMSKDDLINMLMNSSDTCKRELLNLDM